MGGLVRDEPGDQIIEVATMHELHDEVQVILPVEDVFQCDDMFMLQMPHCMYLAFPILDLLAVFHRKRLLCVALDTSLDLCKMTSPDFLSH